MRRMAQALGILTAGHALAGGAYVALINTPDANVLMLMTSLVLVVGALALVVSASTVAMARLVGRSGSWRTAFGMAPAAFLAIAVVGTLCWLAGWGDAWWLAHRGEVDATAIAAGDVTQTAWLHATVRWTVRCIQWVLVPCWLAAGLAWAAVYGLRHVASLKWLVAGLSLRLLATTLVAVVLLVWLPWRAIYWRPALLTSSELEMAFTGTKLVLVFVMANLAWTLVLDAAARSVRRE